MTGERSLMLTGPEDDREFLRRCWPRALATEVPRKSGNPRLKSMTCGG